jgi:6-phosphogluconolactonase
VAAGLAAASAMLWLPASAQAPHEVLVYFGTYTKAASKGIYVSRLDTRSGALTAPELAAATVNPSFLAAHPTGRFLYAVNEISTFEGKPTGAVSGFAIDRGSGGLTLLNMQPSGGADPAHLVIDPAGRNALVANYTGGSVTVLPIGNDGRLKPASAFVQHQGSSKDPERQKGPHAHGIALGAANRFAYVADLGLDKVLIYRFDPAAGTLAAGAPGFGFVAAGSGPRHVAMHPDGRFAYVINEMACTITTFGVDQKAGGLTQLQTVTTLPSGQALARGYSTAEIAVHPSGRFLYGSNRGHDSIAVFAIEPAAGTLTPVEHAPTQGSTPRGFGIDPSGAWLLVGNQRSGSVVVFRIDAKTGTLAATGHQVAVGSPVSVEFVR